MNPFRHIAGRWLPSRLSLEADGAKPRFISVNNPQFGPVHSPAFGPADVSLLTLTPLKSNIRGFDGGLGVRCRIAYAGVSSARLFVRSDDLYEALCRLLRCRAVAAEVGESIRLQHRIVLSVNGL